MAGLYHPKGFIFQGICQDFMIFETNSDYSTYSDYCTMSFQTDDIFLSPVTTESDCRMRIPDFYPYFI